jgi:hypothetical protein
MLYEPGIAGKWLAMLKEIAPQLVRAALMANPRTLPFDYFVRSACGFRRLRPGNPIERGHAFRSKAATFSDEGDRAPLPA